MSTAATYDALRPVPPLGHARQQFAFLLGARDAARRTLDLLLGAPRGAWTLLRRSSAGWLSRILPTSAVAVLRLLLAPMAWLRSATAMVGLVPLVGVALTTPPVRGLGSRELGVIGRLTVRVGSALWRAADAGLRFFGNSGSRLADRLAATGRRVAGRAVSITADPRARLLLDACRTSLRVVGPLSRGVLVHRLLGRRVSPPWLRALIDLAVMPVVLDRRLTRSIRTWLEASLRRGRRGPPTSHFGGHLPGR